MSVDLHYLTTRLTRRFVLKRRLPAQFGKAPILVSSEGGLKYILRKVEEIDPPLLRLVTEFVEPNATVWDVGANLGLFAFAAAAKAGKKGCVLAIEPDTWLVAVLRKTVALQPSTSAKVAVIPAAVADKVDIRTFHISSLARAANHLSPQGSVVAGDDRSEQFVVTLSLDWLAERFPAPQVLKIDVEGAELEVLRGGLGLIARHRPVIICEVHSKNNRAVLDIMQQFDYRIFDAEAVSEKRVELAQPTWNTLALPSGK
jgi:FkbM family methyltransferase